jgi:hypothetical protein
MYKNYKQSKTKQSSLTVEGHCAQQLRRLGCYSEPQSAWTWTKF